ncbi:MAG: hypothetical protein M0021_08835 [Clostridia bacterium]|nr:hypothetical protein [Clostridia bacterium]
MEQNGQGQERIIESYYGELTGEELTGGEHQVFESKLKACLEKMNVLADEGVELKVDILDIIRQGELIRGAKARREEGIAFTIAAGIIVCSVALWNYILGPEFILYAQILLLGISAFAGIPFVKYLEDQEG